MYISTIDNNLNDVVDCLPHLTTAILSVIKLLSLQLNRKNIQQIFASVEEEWELLEIEGDVHILDEITRNGSRIAQLYRRTLLSSLVMFLLLPLSNPMLDIVVKLNETRPREQLFKLYYFVDGEEHFYSIYCHLSLCAVICILMIVTADSLYMILAHHASGMFIVCGYKIKEAIKNNNVNKNGRVEKDSVYREVRQCVIFHKKAIRFFKFLDGMNRKNFLLQIGCSVIGISVTAFQTVVHIGQPDEAFRYGLFFAAQKFHLFYISLPGQIISDHSTEIASDMYCSEWYRTPVEVQKVLFQLQMRSRKSCELSAGGLYNMNIENFGTTVMHINEPDEAIRYALFFIAQNFHLFYISLPGQLISDSSLNIAYSMYDFEWYEAPVKIQKVLFMMQMRASKPCQLTAGGLYDMNIQNFGTTFKTCISYFTMLLSMKE
ncbi:uncharacterized protein LOC143347119 [Colletes latitarsis]|uniref:uncharacterized protein LOC143347119 n=1 Tax=Colletes latitarsis TaxID=2605962 RepID=UPI004036D21F